MPDLNTLSDEELASFATLLRAVMRGKKQSSSEHKDKSAPSKRPGSLNKSDCTSVSEASSESISTAQIRSAINEDQSRSKDITSSEVDPSEPERTGSDDQLRQAMCGRNEDDPQKNLRSKPVEKPKVGLYIATQGNKWNPFENLERMTPYFPVETPLRPEEDPRSEEFIQQIPFITPPRPQNIDKADGFRRGLNEPLTPPPSRPVIGKHSVAGPHENIEDHHQRCAEQSLQDQSPSIRHQIDLSRTIAPFNDNVPQQSVQITDERPPPIDVDELEDFKWHILHRLTFDTPFSYVFRRRGPVTDGQGVVDPTMSEQGQTQTKSVQSKGAKQRDYNLNNPMSKKYLWTPRAKRVLCLLKRFTRFTGQEQTDIFNEIFASHLSRIGLEEGLRSGPLQSQYSDLATRYQTPFRLIFDKEDDVEVLNANLLDIRHIEKAVRKLRLDVSALAFPPMVERTKSPTPDAIDLTEDDEIVMTFPQASTAPADISPLVPQSSKNLTLPDLDRSSHQPRLLYRAWYAGSGGINGAEGSSFFRAGDEELPSLETISEHDFLSAASDHVNRALLPSPFISTSLSLVWSVRLALQHAREKEQNPEECFITVINTEALLKVASAWSCTSILTKVKETPTVEQIKSQTYKGIFEVLIWGAIPYSTVLHTCSLNALKADPLADGVLHIRELLLSSMSVKKMREHLRLVNGDMTETAAAHIVAVIFILAPNIITQHELLCQVILDVVQGFHITTENDGMEQSSAAFFESAVFARLQLGKTFSKAVEDANHINFMQSRKRRRLEAHQQSALKRPRRLDDCGDVIDLLD